MLLPHVTSGPLSLLLASTLALQSQTGSVELAAVPPDPAAEIAQGIAAFSARQPDLALRHFENALAVDSTSYEANWRAALALITLGNETPDSVKSPERDYSLPEPSATPAAQSRPTPSAPTATFCSPAPSVRPRSPRERKSESGSPARSVARPSAPSSSIRGTTGPITSWAGGTRK